MKQLILLLLSIILLASCKKADKKEDIVTTAIKDTKAENGINEKLGNHFSRYRIEPQVIVNNTDDRTEIDFLGHQIKWLDSGKETRFVIDNQQLSLKNEMTLNEMVNSERFNVDLANNWSQIKLYSHGDSEIIAIRMNYSPCSGTGCSVDYYLIYSVTAKTTNYFGTYGIDNEFDNELCLYDFQNGKISFVSKSLTDKSETRHIIYELYSMDDKGIFQIQRKPDGKTYTIEESFGANDYNSPPMLFKQDWIIKIK